MEPKIEPNRRKYIVEMEWRAGSEQYDPAKLLELLRVSLGMDGYDIQWHSCELLEHAPSSPAAPTPHKLSFRAWLISGGAGHEDGVDGIRACTLPLTHAIEMVDEYMEYLAEVTPSPCCANPNMVVKGMCDDDGMSGSRIHRQGPSCKTWRPTHNVCLNCGKEEKI